MVGSGTRNARAISSVVRPPRRRSVIAARASADSTGWQAVNIEPQEIVTDVIIERGFELEGECLLALFEILPELFVLPIEHFGAAEVIDRAMLGGGHQPGAGVVRDARCGPLLERGNERVVREIFGKPHIAHHTRQGRNDFRGFDAPDRVDGAMGVGSRHGYRSCCGLSSGLGMNTRVG